MKIVSSTAIPAKQRAKTPAELWKAVEAGEIQKKLLAGKLGHGEVMLVDTSDMPREGKKGNPFVACRTIKRKIDAFLAAHNLQERMVAITRAGEGGNHLLFVGRREDVLNSKPRNGNGHDKGSGKKSRK